MMEIKDGDSFRKLFGSFSNNKPTKVIIHGWTENKDGRFAKGSRLGLLDMLDFHVIVVDWSGYGSKNVLYPVARSYVPAVARLVAVFLDNFSIEHGVRLEDLHVLGHSLGAHIAGLAGKMVKTGKIGRITGLDPAGPLFSVHEPEERLSINSANFVDVIHTCGYYLGIGAPIGHADFFPNSGKYVQPFCGLDVKGICSHYRSYLLYLESVANRAAFPAVFCHSYYDFKMMNCDFNNPVYMGEGVTLGARGNFYLLT